SSPDVSLRVRRRWRSNDGPWSEPMVRNANGHDTDFEVQSDVSRGARARAADGPTLARHALRQADRRRRSRRPRTASARVARLDARNPRDPRRHRGTVERSRSLGGGRVNLLLDTHVWVWSHVEPDRLTSRVTAALTDVGNELWLSPISIWESSCSRSGDASESSAGCTHAIGWTPRCREPRCMTRHCRARWRCGAGSCEWRTRTRPTASSLRRRRCTSLRWSPLTNGCCEARAFGRSPTARDLFASGPARYSRHMAADARPPRRIILRADVDAFLAAVEQPDDPALRGKPV